MNRVQPVENVVLYSSPIGDMHVHVSDGYIVKIHFIDENEKQTQTRILDTINKKEVENCLTQLEAYFSGKLKNFSLKYRYSGTDFSVKVWQQLVQIPYGTTTSYKDIAIKINHKNAVRAVGGANNRNNIPIVVPCHRVIAKNGSLTGYAEGLWRKQWLLNHEKKHL